MCSRKWRRRPGRGSRCASRSEPRALSATERTEGTCSVTTRTPQSSDEQRAISVTFRSLGRNARTVRLIRGGRTQCLAAPLALARTAVPGGRPDAPATIAAISSRTPVAEPIAASSAADLPATEGSVERRRPIRPRSLSTSTTVTSICSPALSTSSTESTRSPWLHV